MLIRSAVLAAILLAALAGAQDAGPVPAAPPGPPIPAGPPGPPEPPAAPPAPVFTDAQVDAMIDALANEDETERDKALAILLEAGPGVETRVIAYGLKTKHHPAVVIRLARVLGDIHTKPSGGALKALLQNPVSEVQVAAIDALRRFGDEKHMFDIMPLADSEDPAVRREALLVLGQFGFKSAVKGLCDLLREPQADTRVRAMTELRRYPEMKDMVIEAVAPLLTAADPQVALEAAGTLYQFGDARGAAFFTAVLSGKERDYQERAIAYAGAFKVAGAVPFLLKVLKEKDWYLRYIAVDALGRIGDPLALPSLKVLFDAEEVLAVRIATARVFYGFRHPDLLDLLAAKVASEPDVDTRWFIVATIGAIGGENAVWPLIRALMDSKDRIRIEAISSLRDLTGQDMAYDPRAAAKDRAAAVAAWEQWFNRNKKPKP
ncbi:MAG: HEAT repeat domain-containing protein [Planctomycetota bacterium]